MKIQNPRKKNQKSVLSFLWHTPNLLSNLPVQATQEPLAAIAFWKDLDTQTFLRKSSLKTGDSCRYVLPILISYSFGGLVYKRRQNRTVVRTGFLFTAGWELPQRIYKLFNNSLSHFFKLCCCYNLDKIYQGERKLNIYRK